MQVRLGIGIPCSGNAAAAFRPSDISGLILWLDPSSGITLSTTLFAEGTTPPVVTMSGTLGQSCPLKLGNFTGGTLGVATFQWTVDNGATWSASIATAASVAIGTTGLTVAFPAGTYNANNTYKAAVSAWVDRAVGNNLVQATTSLQPVLEYNAALGGVCVRPSGTSSRLVCATGGLTGSAAHSLFTKVQWKNVGPTSGAGICAIGKAGGSTSMLAAIGAGYVTCYGGSGLGSGFGSPPAVDAIVRMGKTRIAAGDTVGYVDGAQDMAPTSLAFNLTAGFTAGAFVDGGPASFVAPFTHVLAYSKALSAGEIAQVDAFLAV